MMRNIIYRFTKLFKPSSYATKNKGKLTTKQELDRMLNF